jgi:hypothetical protein
MPNSEEMNPVLLRVEGVNDPIVANASSKTVRSFQPMMWKRFEAQSDFIDFRFDACTQSGWQLEENGIETRGSKSESLRSRAFRPTHTCGFSSGHVAF